MRRRRRSQVAAQPRHGGRLHAQPRLLADRIRRRDRSRPTSGSRSSCPRSAPSSSRASTSSRRRSTPSTRAPSPRRKWGARATGGADKWKYTVLVGEDRGRRQRHPSRNRRVELSRAGLLLDRRLGRVRRDIGSSFVSLLYCRARDRRRRLEPRLRSRLRVAADRPGHDHRAAALEHIADARPPRPRRRVGRPLSQRPCRPPLVEPLDGDVGHLLRVSRLRRRIPRRQRLRAAGRLPVGIRRARLHLPLEGPRRPPIARLRLGRLPSGPGREDHAAPGGRRQRPRRAAQHLRAARARGPRPALGSRALSACTGSAPISRSAPATSSRASDLRGQFGDEVDFANDRLGDGGTLLLEADLRPTDHVALALSLNRRWLDVNDAELGSGRLLTSQVARLKAVYTFNAKSWLRLIGQWVETERDPSLYYDEVDMRVRRPLGLARLRLQAQLADRALRRLLRPAGARDRNRSPRALRPRGLPQGLLRLPRLSQPT